MEAAQIIEFPMSPAFPAILDTPRFRLLWDQWVEERQGYKRPRCGWDRFFSRQLELLAPHGEDVAYQTVQFSLMNGYQGLFPDRFMSRAVVTTTLSPQALLHHLEKQLMAKEKEDPGLPTKCLVSDAEWASAMEAKEKWRSEVRALKARIAEVRKGMVGM